MRNKKKLFITIVLSMLLVAAIFTYRALREHSDPSVQIPFSTEQWIRYPNKRISMIDSLMSTYDGLQGLTREKVEALLGESMSDGIDSNHAFYIIAKTPWSGFTGEVTILSISYRANMLDTWSVCSLYT